MALFARRRAVDQALLEATMKSYAAKFPMLTGVVLSVVAGALLVGLTGCGPAADSASAVGSQKLSAGCGMCIYKMPGVEGCETAVKVDGKPDLVTGAKTDAMAPGLCGGEKTAEVTGKVEGDKFVATSFKLVK